MYCSSLGDLVWLCLQQVPENINEPQPYYSFTLFDGLQFSSTSLSTWSPETLCHLDLLAFLAATVYCQRVVAKETHGKAVETREGRVRLFGMNNICMYVMERETRLWNKSKAAEMEKKGRREGVKGGRLSLYV